MRTDIRLSGSGGQGLITAARILAKAALLDGFDSIQSQVYGAEARGGATKSEVVISTREIYYPEVVNPDITAIMTAASYKKYGQAMSRGSLRIIDSFMVPDYEEYPGVETIGLPFTAQANKNFKSKVLTNMILMGYIIAKTGIVRPESFMSAIGDFFKEEKLEKNHQAFSLGYKLI